MTDSPEKTLQITVARQVVLPKAQLHPVVRRFLREKLFIPNSDYIVKQRLGKPLYNVPKFFDLIEEDSTCLRLPRGFLGQLTGLLAKERIAFTVTYDYPGHETCVYTNNIALRPEQAHLVDEVFAAGSGVLVAPPGSGKTIMGLELVARHQKPALILTHRKQLLDQWVETIQAQFGIPKKQIGRYSSAYKKPGEHITVGLLQSFARMKDISAFADMFGVIIVDECHHIPATTFRAVISQLNAPHAYGLTATPRRKHNDERLIYLYISDTVAVMDTSTGSGDTKESAGFDITIRQTSLRLPFDWKRDQFELLAKTICYDTARNEQIIQDISARVKQGRRILVLSERKEHLKILELHVRSSCRTLTFSGEDSASSRAAKLEQIDQGAYEVLLATGQIFGEGIHIPNVEVLVLAFPFAFVGKLTQYVGRLAHGTNPCELIDYRDAHIETLEKQYKQRRRYYNKIQPL